MFDPITPERATPEAFKEVLDAYSAYLDERDHSVVAEDPARAAKIESSLLYCEKVMRYYLSFLIGTPRLDPITEGAVDQLVWLRDHYAATYTVPDIETAASQLAREARRAARKPSTARTSAAPRTSPPAKPTPTQQVMDFLAQRASPTST